jgi:phosphatidylserine/phosphatidylglycerophosphate/cardiolipin synthase-like enzyme
MLKTKVGLLLIGAIFLPLSTPALAWGIHPAWGARHYSTEAGNASAGAGNPGVSQLTLQQATATVAFSPDGGGEQIIVQAINAARSRILVQAYGFTDRAILSALAQAKARGVDVRVILDKTNDRSGGNESRYSGATYMLNAGVPVWTDYKPAIAHNKVMIIDGQEVITGSFNFTSSAQRRNVENVLILNNVPQLAAVYTKDWVWRLGESRVFQK